MADAPQCPNEHDPAQPANVLMLGDASWKCTGLLPGGVPCGYRAGRTGEQDAPVHNNGPSMHDLVIEHLRSDGAPARSIEIMSARRDLGLSRYQTILQAHNGRDWLADLTDELADAVVYARQGIAEIVVVGGPEWNQAWQLYSAVLTTYRGAVLAMTARDQASSAPRPFDPAAWEAPLPGEERDSGPRWPPPALKGPPYDRGYIGPGEEPKLRDIWHLGPLINELGA